MNYDGPKYRTGLGVFSYAPPLHRSGFLHSDGQAASSLNGSPRLHVKNDNTNFTYVGRSYGAGSLVGLEMNGLNLSRGVMAYNFHEIGWVPNTTCIYNSSTPFGLELVQYSSDPAIPSIYDAGDIAGQKQKRDFTMVGFGGDAAIVAVAHYPPANMSKPVWYNRIAAGSIYATLNATQCATIFRPTEFSVEVDLQRRLITVTPESSEGIVSIEETYTVPYFGVQTLGGMSMIDTDYFTSVMGDMLMDSKFDSRSIRELS